MAALRVLTFRRDRLIGHIGVGAFHVTNKIVFPLEAALSILTVLSRAAKVSFCAVPGLQVPGQVLLEGKGHLTSIFIAAVRTIMSTGMSPGKS